GLWLAKYKDIEIYYDSNLEKERVRIMLSSILNEQSYDLSNSSPHQYLSIDEVHSNDVIYDVGAAEGYQSKVWSKKAKKIVVFEPDPKQINCLNKTFIKEISSGKVIIIPFGVSNFTGQKLIFGQEYQFATLKDLIRKFSLPLPTIIKADIEGHEMQLLQGAKDILTNGSVRIVQIATYHRSNDEYDIPNYLSKFGGVGKFSDGTIYFNRTFDNYTNLLIQEQYEQLFQPVFRKCLYTHWFKS
ncbi:FkbM family methyltransferase, partial [Salinivibrio sp. AR640]|uniref:FkbM family methyltransferase n=1 Tax=Salinivibrio sp. AR640 TaxID=1909437 RepID=UPI0009841965